MSDLKKSSPEDIIIHYSEETADHLGSISVPIYQTSLFSRKKGPSGYSYTRINNPTIEVVEKKLAEIEKAEAALLFSSGMAAITSSVMRYVKTGARIAAVKNVYLSVEVFFSEYLKNKFDVETRYFDADDYSDFLRAVEGGVDIIYLETAVSNVFSMPDIERISGYAKSIGAVVIVDNTYATPIFCNPVELGADLVLHSCSKYINGHSDLIAGAVMGSREVIEDMRCHERSFFGSSVDPHQAWLLLRGMRTLPLRMERHMKNGMELAAFLESHPKIEKVIYPALQSHPRHAFAKKVLKGFPGLFCFVPAGGIEKAEKLYHSLTIPEVGPSWGGFETIMNGPGMGITPERSAMTGILPGQIRISVGLEDIETLISDFRQALDEID